jgi:tRNA(Ile)-lysidine synthase
LPRLLSQVKGTVGISVGQRAMNLPIPLDASLLGSLRSATETMRSQITVRFRRGGERCKPVGCGHHRDLKKLFQEAGVPPWERDPSKASVIS